MAMTMTSAIPPMAGGNRRQRAPTSTTTMAPPSLSNRRRRAPTTGDTFARTAGQQQDREEKQEEVATNSNTNSFRRSHSSKRTAVRFARFDDELEDSDQTIADFNKPRMVYSLPAAARRRQPEDHHYQPLGNNAALRTKSTFFPDSTDDDEMAKRMSTSMRASATGVQPASHALDAGTFRGGLSMGERPTFPVIHIGDVQFPVTRTVLWDRRVLAGPFPVATQDVLPRIRIRNAVLKQLHTLLIQDAQANNSNSKRSSKRLLAYVGVENPSSSTTTTTSSDGWVVLSQLVHDKPEGATSQWLIPVYHSKPQYKEEVHKIRKGMVHAVRTQYETTSGGGSSNTHTQKLTSSLFAMSVVASSIVVALCADQSRASMDVTVESVVPDLALEFHLVRSLPLLMTPLAASLLRCEFGSESLRCGFLTLDRARKAVPLLETDPLASQRPIVGLWVYGVSIVDTETTEAIHVAHPYLVQSCVRFLVSKIIKERALVDEDTFLVAVYPGKTSGPLPRFLECRVVDQAKTTAAHPVAWQVAQASGRCLAGVSSFKNDLEMTLVMETEQAESSPPQPPQQRARVGGTDHYQSKPVGEASATVVRIATERSRDLRESVAQDQRPSQAAVRAETTKNRREKKEDVEDDNADVGIPLSCCHSQQLLAMQHQELLNKQERQLHDMQEQIADLQRVLTETRAENARLLATSLSGSSIAVDEIDDLQRMVQQEADNEDKQEEDEEDAPTPTTVGDDDDDGESKQDVGNHHDLDEDGHFDLDNGNDYDDNNSNGSSLALSSISQRSDQSDLSSISSSLVGMKLKTLFTTELPARDNATICDAETMTDEKEPEPAVKAKSDHEVAHSMCPYTPPARPRTITSSAQRRRHPQCERDEFEDDADASKIDALLSERLHIPVTPNREEIVRSGTLTTFGFTHGSSFSIPKIKYVADATATCDSDDDDEEELRRIELKYRKKAATIRKSAT